MKKVIENIRNKPSHHKDRIIWICAAIAIGILLIVWLLVGNGRNTAPDKNFLQDFQTGVDEGKTLVPQNQDSVNTNSSQNNSTSTNQ